MMSANFKEYMIKQKKSTKDILAQAGIIFVGIVAVLLSMTMLGTLIGSIILIAVLVGGSYLCAIFNREYEYILTNEELDIDVVYSLSRRKRVVTVNLRKIEFMAAMDDPNYRNEIERKKVAKVFNASDNSNSSNTYVIIGETQFGLTKIILSPNKDFLEEMHHQSPNKIFCKK